MSGDPLDGLKQGIAAQDKFEEHSDIEKALDLMDKIYNATNKHYRTFFEDELENDKTIFPKPIFYNAEIKRGQSRGVEKSWFSFGAGQQDESGQESTIRVVGKFKGTIDIVNKEEMELFEREKREILGQIFQTLQQLYGKKTGEECPVFSLESVATSSEKSHFMAECKKMGLNCISKLTEYLEGIRFSGIIKEMLQRNSEAIVHLYLIKGNDFASRDIGSPSDPYLVVSCGETEFNDRDNY